jgi:ribulose-5-phosphate 4-epimerase/fuculose-1-phosphate aldolase
MNPDAKVPNDGDELATKLLCALSAEVLRKADCFDYLCWLEETQQSDRVKSIDFLLMASDGTTCWGKTFEAAVHKAMLHDKELYDAVKNLELPE